MKKLLKRIKRWFKKLKHNLNQPISDRTFDPDAYGKKQYNSNVDRYSKY